MSRPVYLFGVRGRLRRSDAPPVYSAGLAGWRFVSRSGSSPMWTVERGVLADFRGLVGELYIAREIPPDLVAMLDEADEAVAEAEEALRRARAAQAEVRDMVASRGAKVRPE